MRGFTLLEPTIGVAIVGILAAISSGQHAIRAVASSADVGIRVGWLPIAVSGCAQAPSAGGAIRFP